MRYYAQYDDSGYLTTIGTGNGGTEITEARYNELLGIIRNRPQSPEGYDYHLTADLEWELYELPPVESDELTEAEAKAAAYDILTGGIA